MANLNLCHLEHEHGDSLTVTLLLLLLELCLSGELDIKSKKSWCSSPKRNKLLRIFGQSEQRDCFTEICPGDKAQPQLSGSQCSRVQLFQLASGKSSVQLKPAAL